MRRRPNMRCRPKPGASTSPAAAVTRKSAPSSRGGEVASVDDLVTFNLDIEKFAQDAIAESEGPELVRAFWQALGKVSILDPTCGSGAFLFAALNILEPLYLTCLEAMRGFLDDLERAPRRRRPEYLSDFRKALANVDAHASERYFILKSIVVDNLYGVDIMEEAVEICKLRLFLKLAAQLDRPEDIEPLPDIDFNIRAGNTLVGFASLDEVREAFRTAGNGQRRMLYPEDEEKLKDIEEKAKIADDAFRMFREMQTEQGMDAGALAGAKAKLRERLAGLRAELDRYLAGEYGVKTDNKMEYAQWLAGHQPFSLVRRVLRHRARRRFRRGDRQPAVCGNTEDSRSLLSAKLQSYQNGKPLRSLS